MGWLSHAQHAKQVQQCHAHRFAHNHLLLLWLVMLLVLLLYDPPGAVL
jgi:hypothetical protein